jgi:hypothetical protein
LAEPILVGHGKRGFLKKKVVLKIGGLFAMFNNKYPLQRDIFCLAFWLSLEIGAL